MWDADQLHNEVAEEFASFDHIVEEDEARGRQIVTQARAERRQVRRALDAIAGREAHEKRKAHNRASAARRREKVAVAPAAPVGRPRLPRPSKRRVMNLRQKGHSWPEVARRLKCSEWIARTVAGAVKTQRVPVKS
jgi:hypothetical protein